MPRTSSPGIPPRVQISCTFRIAGLTRFPSWRYNLLSLLRVLASLGVQQHARHASARCRSRKSPAIRTAVCACTSRARPADVLGHTGVRKDRQRRGGEPHAPAVPSRTRDGKKPQSAQRKQRTQRQSSESGGQAQSMWLAIRPTAIAVSVCRLSALTNVRPGIEPRAANSCAEAT